jgi:hypothetical protein
MTFLLEEGEEGGQQRRGVPPWYILYRSFIVLGVGSVTILSVFFAFVGAGWPGAPDDCIKDDSSDCFCESFNVADVLTNAAGVRQPANTFSNFYSFATAGFVAFVVHKDRLIQHQSSNLMRGSHSWVADLYVFCVLHLGLGSMFFHGSLTQWGGFVDVNSMYWFTSFLSTYTVRRMWNNAPVFYVSFFALVTIFTAMKLVADAVVSIAILVVLYFLAEVAIGIRTKTVLQGTRFAIAMWLCAIVCILFALFFWAASSTGGFLCVPESAMQAHGLWHVLAGCTATFLFLFWRAEGHGEHQSEGKK